MSRSRIEWTEVTWNPTTGCDRVSTGCDHCYALTLAKRLKGMGSAKYQNDGDSRTSGPGFGVTTHEHTLTAPLRWREPRIVFVNSMSDLFHARVPAEFVARVFAVMAATPQHTYQVLTKRATRLRRLAADLPWPGNVWMGVSVENADVTAQVDELRQVPAAVRFLSCEPLLGPLDGIDLDGIGWVIAGGESGPGARLMDPAWPAGLRRRVPSRRRAVLFQAVGRPRPEGRRATARRPHLGRHARNGSPGGSRSRSSRLRNRRDRARRQVLAGFLAGRARSAGAAVSPGGGGRCCGIFTMIGRRQNSCVPSSRMSPRPAPGRPHRRRVRRGTRTGVGTARTSRDQATPQELMP